MTFRIIPVTPLAQNCTVVWCEQSKDAAVIDPGGDIERIMQFARSESLSIKKIWLTHGHIDHVAGAVALQKESDALIEGPHEADRYWLDALPSQARMFGFGPTAAFLPDRWLNPSDKVTIGAKTIEVIHCPGHTPGHIVFYDRAERWAQVGDVLFSGSIGRTDFSGGSYEALIDSIRQRLFPLGDDVQFTPGHGPSSSFGKERLTNPFVGER